MTNPSANALTATAGGGASTCASVSINPDGSFVATPSTTTAGLLQLHVQGVDVDQDGERRRHDHRELPARLRARRQRLRRTEHTAGQGQGRDQRLPLDHRGGPHLLDRPAVPDQQSRRDAARLARPGLPAAAGGKPRLQLPHRQHAGGGAGLRRPDLVRGRPDAPRRQRRLRCRQRRLPPCCAEGRTPARRRQPRPEQALLHLHPARRRREHDHRRRRRSDTGWQALQHRPRLRRLRPGEQSQVGAGWAGLAVRPRHGRRADRQGPDRRQHRAAADAAADGQDFGLRVPGRQPAERRERCRRRRRHRGAERGRPRRLRDQAVRPGRRPR